MKTRTGEIRKDQRRVLLWSLFIASALHVAVFLAWPTMTVKLPPQARSHDASVYVDVLFGPPGILGADGSISREPLERFLGVDRILNLKTECQTLTLQGETLARGSVYLRVGKSGHAGFQRIHESTGHECADQVIAGAAAALRYDWLPNERFPAPVDLIQPVTVLEARELSIRLPTSKRPEGKGNPRAQ